MLSPGLETPELWKRSHCPDQPSRERFIPHTHLRKGETYLSFTLYQFMHKFLVSQQKC